MNLLLVIPRSRVPFAEIDWIHFRGERESYIRYTVSHPDLTGEQLSTDMKVLFIPEERSTATLANLEGVGGRGRTSLKLKHFPTAEWSYPDAQGLRSLSLETAVPATPQSQPMQSYWLHFRRTPSGGYLRLDGLPGDFSQITRRTKEENAQGALSIEYDTSGFYLGAGSPNADNNFQGHNRPQSVACCIVCGFVSY